MFAVIFIPNFALQAVLRREPELRLSAVALVDSAPQSISKAIVLECNEAAKEAGVCEGLTAPQAMARCRELVVKPRSSAAEQEVTNILLQTAYAFSPNIESTAPGVCTIDLRGLAFEQSEDSQVGRAVLSAPFDGERDMRRGEDIAPYQGVVQQSFEFFRAAEMFSLFPWREDGDERKQMLLIDWAEGIIAALRELNLTAQIGIALTPNLALLAARPAQPVFFVKQPAEFFASLPITALEPAPELLGILKRWGIHTVGAFLALGKDAIAERLGVEALELFERASTDTIRPLNIVVPPDTFEEQMDFEVMVETIEPLLFVLRRFIGQLAMRIALSYRVVAELHLHLALESGAAYERTFKIPAPTANVETLFRMLHTHLETLHTDAPITSLQLNAQPIRAETQQFGLFESALRDPNHFHETLARLAALLGAERVGTPVLEATHRPDSFRMEMPKFGECQTEVRNPKPETRNSSGLCLRRFRPAIHAEVELEHGRPVFISTLVVSGAVKRARGPWCVSGTWWDQRRWSRQEWDVETRDGAVYRLFNSNGDWLVEGVYD